MLKGKRKKNRSRDRCITKKENNIEKDDKKKTQTIRIYNILHMYKNSEDRRSTGPALKAAVVVV